MALYAYLKAPPVARTRFRGGFQLLPYGLIVVGTVLLANVFLPLFLYQLNRGRFQATLISPVISSSTISTQAEVDYSQPNNWFPASPPLPPRPSKITHYNLSIPQLGIKEAVAQIGGEDLLKSLIHYPGTALPGQYGNAVVFGHSVLPQFFNPQNYKTIFSTLPNLKGGDEILIDFDGVTYRYLVTQIVETFPEDVTVLEQHYDAEYLTLVTCVPPGTYLKRLVVRARLVL